MNQKLQKLWFPTFILIIAAPEETTFDLCVYVLRMDSENVKRVNISDGLLMYLFTRTVKKEDIWSRSSPLISAASPDQGCGGGLCFFWQVNNLSAWFEPHTQLCQLILEKTSKVRCLSKFSTAYGHVCIWPMVERKVKRVKFEVGGRKVEEGLLHLSTYYDKYFFTLLYFRAVSVLFTFYIFDLELRYYDTVI